MRKTYLKDLLPTTNDWCEFCAGTPGTHFAHCLDCNKMSTTLTYGDYGYCESCYNIVLETKTSSDRSVFTVFHAVLEGMNPVDAFHCAYNNDVWYSEVVTRDHADDMVRPFNLPPFNNVTTRKEVIQMEAFLPDGKTPRCQDRVKSGAQCNNGAQKGFTVCGPHNKGQAPATPAVATPVEATPVETTEPKGWLSYKLTCVQCGHVFQLSFDSVEQAMNTQAAFKAANGICKRCRW